jgi:hypothetical protein
VCKIARTRLGIICTAVDYTMAFLFNYKRTWDGDRIIIINGNITEEFDVWELIILSYLMYRVPVGV